MELGALSLFSAEKNNAERNLYRCGDHPNKSLNCFFPLFCSMNV